MAALGEAIARVEALVRGADGLRVVIGICGAPGAGKSTFTNMLQRGLEKIGIPTGWVPMDGFHLADATLDAAGLRGRKGAPDTFDPWGYAHLLRRLSDETDHVVYAPAFERTLEQPIAAGLGVASTDRVVLTEGNYLLLDLEPWRIARSHCDEVWFVDVDDEVRRARLRDRHVRFGKSADSAASWVDDVDEPNARIVQAGRHRADWVLLNH